MVIAIIQYNKTTEHFANDIIYLLNTELLFKFSYKIIFKLSELKIHTIIFNFKFKITDLEYFYDE